MAEMTMLRLTLAALVLALGTMPAFGHSARSTLDSAGNRATFTGLARVTCFDDGGGTPALLMARIRDTSPPVAGLLVNLQLVKGTAALSITDTSSGDAGYSDFIALPGGGGEYIMMVNKTAAGARNFDLEWHCMTAGNVHTGTDIALQQFQ